MLQGAAPVLLVRAGCRPLMREIDLVQGDPLRYLGGLRRWRGWDAKNLSARTDPFPRLAMRRIPRLAVQAMRMGQPIRWRRFVLARSVQKSVRWVTTNSFLCHQD